MDSAEDGTEGVAVSSRIVSGRIDVAALRAAVDDPGFGAVIVFEGVARNTFGGRRVVRLEYEAYAEMADPVLASIVAEAAAQWPMARVVIVHRTGAVAIGEASVVVAVGAPHRGEAYAASRYAIDALKARLPVWKKEIYEDGTAWKANAAE
ncbi:MAG: molybdenum cofactor biosynthesis protein MoaE [Myxococcota bacterium]